MNVASYEDRSDPESLRMERTENDHTFLKTESQNWGQNPLIDTFIYVEILEMKIILRVAVQQSRWMIKLLPYVNWDVREKTSCCDIIETNTVNKSLKRKDAVPQIEEYTPPPPPPPSSLYPYRAYIETLLSYGPLSLYEWKKLKKTIPLFEDREPELRTMDNKVTGED